MGSRAYYSVLISFFSGIFFVSVQPKLAEPLMLVAVLAIFCLAASYLYVKNPKKLLCIFTTLAFLAGAARMSFSASMDHPLDAHLGTRVSLVGFICSDPKRGANTETFCFEPLGSSDRVVITAGRYPEYEYGDVLKAEGKLALPRNFEAYEGGPEFDYVSYLAKDGMRFSMFRPKLEDTGIEGGSTILGLLFGFKRILTDKMRDLFSEPESSLLGGLLLGDKSGLPKEVTEDFKTVGLVHILVLSGYNVTVVAESLMKAFSFLPRTIGKSAGVLSIILFALMTGASSTTVRASIMALIVLLAKSSSRRYDAARALSAAAFVMALQNPSIVAFDVSFELSFLATLSLIYVAPLVSEKLSWVTEKWNMREILSTTIATQAFVFPFLVYTMGQISLISLVSNLLVLSFIPYAMFAGFMALVLGFISHLAALPLAWAGSLVLSYILAVGSVFSHVPYASVHIKTGAFALVLCYLAYVVILIRAWRRRNSSPESAN